MAWNPGHEQFESGIDKWKDILSNTDILFVNKEEASLFSGVPYKLAGIKQDDPRRHIHAARAFLPPYADDVSAIMRKFLKYGVKNIVITDGKNGAQASDGKNLYFCPVITHKKVDTLGAGDAFASGFSSAIILGKDLETALKYGTINANSVISFFGAQTGLLTRKEMEKRFKELDISITKAKLC
jgi:sugar/nucleoside kinase (ribokinase family)